LTPLERLRAKIDDGSVTLGIVGLGYIGLPLALTFAERGHRVLGFDIDPTKIAAIARGEGYIQHLDGGRVARAVAAGTFSATADFTRLALPDALIVCVPTPLSPQREPDMSYVEATTRAIGATLRSGQLVILESTTYPGTTDGLVRDLLDATGLILGSDYFLAFSPEREDPGNPHFDTASIPKVVGGVDAVSGDLAEALYARAISKTVRVSTARTAEAAKLVENIFRAVNIALVNELKVVYDRMDVDVWEAIDAAATKPFGYLRFDPGPGWGGHCIPIDPFYLTWKAREYGVTSRFIELAGEVNTAMPEWVVGKLQLALNDDGKAVRGARILVLGVAYKRDVDDTRESPALEILPRLLALGAEVSFHDPHVPVMPVTRHAPELAGQRSVALTPEVLAAADGVLIVTDHRAVDYDQVAQHARLVVDTRGVMRGRSGAARVVPA
jgi:UDP-N-acetyl-D-glucosamine dehydrogenase